MSALNGSQHMVKTITTVTIILTICNEKRVRVRHAGNTQSKTDARAAAKLLPERVRETCRFTFAPVEVREQFR